MNRLLSGLLTLLLFGTLSACSGDSGMDDPIDDIPARLTGTWTGVVVGTSAEEQPVTITIVQGVEVNGVLRLDRVEGTGTITLPSRGELNFEIQGEYFHPFASFNLLFTVNPPVGMIQGVVSEDRRSLVATMTGPSISGSVTFMLERQ